MKPTLYEALGLSPAAAESEIKAALRRLVRRYYTRTRAGHADVEEALRFLNHASHVLGNSHRRADYDSELAKGISTQSSLTTVGAMSAREVDRPASAVESAVETAEKSEPTPSITQIGIVHQQVPVEIEPIPIPEWTAQLADFRRTRAGELAGLLVAFLVFFAVWKLALPQEGAGAVVRAAMVGLFVTGVAAGIVYAIVHVLSQTIWKPPASETAITIVEGMIPRWRRDRTVFMGTGGPVEDATWLFRLRMAELKRVSAERVSDPQPVMRLFARLLDYGVWGVVLFGMFGLLQMAGPGAAQLAQMLAHPLVAPVLITATWIPLEALLLAQSQTTPGRWLLCVYLHYQVSNPYAPEELRFTFDAAIRRALDVWVRGCGAGVPVLSMFTVARAREHISKSGETTWDSQRDCLVTHGPVGSISLVSLVIAMSASALAFASWWMEPAKLMVGSTQRAMTAMNARVGSSTDVSVPMPASRVARVDDVSTAPPVAPAAVAPSIRESKARLAPVPESPSAPSKQVRGTVTTAPPAPASKSHQVSVPVLTKSEAAPGARSPDTGSPPGAPSPLEKRDRRIAAYLQQAQRQQARGEYAALVTTCRRWADEDWRNPRAYYCAGIGLQNTGQHKQAIEMLNKASTLLSRDDPLKLLVDDAVVRSFRAESGR